MRFIPRLELTEDLENYLGTSRAKIETLEKTPPVDSTKVWKLHRQHSKMLKILEQLQKMGHHKCMYCVHNEGSDIEHFYPKSKTPLALVFTWSNYLLCCTKCGNHKLNQFPLDTLGQPLLINPTLENPWDYLVFIPSVGTLAARFEISSQTKNAKGNKTVEVLHLNRRELLRNEYKKTWDRLVKVVKKFLNTPYSETEFIEKLLEKDNHHLLGWCFHGTGETESPFSELKQQYPNLWQHFVNHPELLIPATQEKL
jgi:uncharacterized protein (TIGR02646 family)